VWLILFTSWVQSHFIYLFIYLGKGPYWLTYHQCFLEHSALPNRSTSLDPKSQNGHKCASPMAYLFSFYIYGHWKLNFVQTIWDKTEVLLGNNLGTWWEQGKKKAKKSPLPPKRKKNWTPHEGILSLFIGCMNFYVWNRWQFPAAAHPKRKKNWTPREGTLSLLIGCMDFYFQNCLSPFLTVGNGRGTTVRNNKKLIKASVMRALHEMFWMKNNKFILICNN
jgi:hypothetical protein